MKEAKSQHCYERKGVLIFMKYVSSQKYTEI